MQQHCNTSKCMRCYDQWWINKRLNITEWCPTYKSIDGLQKAIAQSFKCTTVNFLINQSPEIGSDGHWDDAICCLIQATLEEFRWGAQKGIILSYRRPADNQPEAVISHNPALYRSAAAVAALLICFHVLLLVKCERLLMTIEITCIPHRNKLRDFHHGATDHNEFLSNIFF